MHFKHYDLENLNVPALICVQIKIHTHVIVVHRDLHTISVFNMYFTNGKGPTV
jgi:hypothetical protein